MAKALSLPDLAATGAAGDAGHAGRNEAAARPLHRIAAPPNSLVRDGQVMLSLDDSPPFAVTRIGENRYLARPKPDIAGPEFVLQPATKDAPAYLHFALWAYAK